MADDTTKLFLKTLTISELADQITTFESALGPLIALGRTAEKTAATFKPGRSPDNEMKIATVVPPDGIKVCEGKIWNAGVRVDAKAFRQPDA